MASSTPTTADTTNVDVSALPPDHLSHPESWATGADPATSKQLGFIAVLEKQHDVHVPEERLDGVGKSEASEIIDGLKHGKVPPPHDATDGFPTGEKRDADNVDKDQAEATEDDDRKKRRKTDGGEDKSAENGDKTDKPDASEDAEMKDGEPLVEHPEKWTTGSEPATGKQLAFIATLEKQHDAHVPKKDHLNKSQATELIDELKDGKVDGDTKTTEDVESTLKSKAGIDTAADSQSKTDSETKPKSASPKKKSNGTASSPVATTIVPDKADKADGEDDHLDHPEKWATGEDPATDKQLGYLAVLEKQKGVKALTEAEREGDLGKSEASEKIEELKKD